MKGEGEKLNKKIRERKKKGIHGREEKEKRKKKRIGASAPK